MMGVPLSHATALCQDVAILDVFYCANLARKAR